MEPRTPLFIRKNNASYSGILLAPDSCPQAIARSIRERSLWELRKPDTIYG
jgi:hypothetical protein